jgi:3-dehydroquinate dehydratase II
VQILVLNGVNLDVLGRRDPVLYGGLSIDELETRIYHWANEAGHTARCRQTNSEGEYIDWIHDAIDWQGGIIVNAAAWTHYSYALRDALEILTCPWVEVHLSNVDEREDWRRISVIEGLASHRIVGKGPQGYKEAIEWLSANANG